MKIAKTIASVTDHHQDRIVYIGETTHRNRGVRFGIRRADRRSHLYVIGRTGTGKSTLLKAMALQDLVRDENGLAFLDPHGDVASELAATATSRRDLTVWTPADPLASLGLNPLAGGSDLTRREKTLRASQLVEVFKSLWADAWGPRLEHLLRNVVFLLLEQEDASLADVGPLLSEREFRTSLLGVVENEEVRQFWEKEYARYSPGFRAVVVAPLQNKLGAMLTDPLMKRILTGDLPQLDVGGILNDGRALVVDLAKGEIGSDNASLLGSLLVSRIAQEGLARATTPEEDRRDVFVYLDEFQHFTTLSLATMLSELRKYRVSLILAHQHLSQLQPEIRDAVLGNVGTFLSFRVGAQDASLVAKELGEPISAADLVKLPNHHIYLKLLIEGEPSKAFSARTIEPGAAAEDVWPRTNG